MALTAAEQKELNELLELERLQKVDAARQKGQAEYDDSLMVQKLAYGVARPFQQIGYGIKDLFSGLTEEDQLRLEEIAGKEGLIASGGEIAGELAGFAIPAAKIGQFMSKVGQYAPKFLQKITPALAADFGLTVGAEGIKAPTEGRTRGDNMADTAKGYAATALGLKGLKETWRAARPSVTGAKLLDQGIPLTPGQASDNPIVQGVEETVASLPFVSKGVERLQQNSLEGWNTNLLNQASPGPEITGVGSDAFSQLIKGFDDAYGAAYKSIKPEEVDFPSIGKSLQTAFNDSGQRVQSTMVLPTQRVLSDANKELNRFAQTGDKQALQNANKILKDASIDDRGAQDIIKELRGQVSKAMGKGGSRLRDIDRKYAKFAILRDAASGTKDPLQSNLVIAPANLTGAMKKPATPNQLVTEEGFLQQAAQEGTDTYSRTRPGRNVLRRALAATGVGGASLLDPQTAAISLLATAGATSEPGRKAVTKMMQGAGQQSAYADALREGAAKGIGLTPEEINRLLMRGGGLSQTAGDTEGYE